MVSSCDPVGDGSKICCSHRPTGTTAGTPSVRSCCCRMTATAFHASQPIVSDRPRKLSGPIGSVLVDVFGRSVTTHGH